MEENLTELLQARRRKIDALKEKGIEPFYGQFKRTHQVKEILNNFESLKGQKVIIGGRLMSKRGHGKAAFANVADMGGNIQIYIRKDHLGEEAFDIFKSLIDIGDIIGVEGEIFRTKKEEISIRVKKITLLTKSLLPLPEKFHGLKDVDLRYRQRYLDMIMNADIKDTFVIRSKILREIRYFLDSQDFLEVETPVLTSVAGGASARPFITHHNTLDMDLFLRISLELPLKRLIVGGIERVYELGRVFRNEGVSTKHNPEFTLLEVYQAYGDLRDMMSLTENMVATVAKNVLGKTQIVYQGTLINFKPPWRKISMIDVVKEHTGVDFKAISSDEEAMAICKDHLDIECSLSKGELLNEMFEAHVENQLIQPTFVYGYPLEISPLAKKLKDNSMLTDRFEVFVFGRELANSFSELNDPIDQKERFLDQIARKEAGYNETQPYDSDFITALEYGMPPTGGMGIGIDRLVMFLTNAQSIRDIIIYPAMKNKN